MSDENVNPEEPVEEISQDESVEEVVDSVSADEPEVETVAEEVVVEVDEVEADEPLDPTDAPTSDDKLWSALGYPIPLIALIALLMDDKKDRPFVRFHAIQAIAFNIVLWVVIFAVSLFTLGFGAICAPVLWLISLWPAYDSYRGNYTEIPVLTNFLKGQNWV